MSALVTASKLFWIWASMCGLLMVTGAILCLLLAKRHLQDVEHVSAIGRKARWKKYIYAAIYSPVHLDENALPEIEDTDRRVIMDLSLDIMRGMEGKDNIRVTELLTIWQMQPYIFKIVRTGAKGRRIRALTVLGYFMDTASMPVLLESLAAEDVYVRLAALRALAIRQAVQCLPQIVQSMTMAGAVNIPLLADTLRRFGEPIVPSLINIVHDEKSDVSIRAACIAALGSIGSLKSVDDLIAAMRDSDPVVIMQSLDALGKIGDARAIYNAILLMKHDHPGIRAKASHLLGILQQPAAIPSLSENMDDEKWIVRFHAARALYSIGERGIAILRAHAANNDRSGVIATQILAEMGG